MSAAHEPASRPIRATPAGRPRMLITWLGLAAVTWLTGKWAERYGLPAPHLLAAVCWGIAAALSGVLRTAVPTRVHWLAQAVTGVVIGMYFDSHSLARTGSAMGPLLVVTALTLALSVGIGLVLARRTGMDRATASLGMVAGGSAAVVATADDLGADARLVAFMQYLRLTLVVLSTPLLVRFVLAPHTGHFAALGAKEIEVEGSVGGYTFLFAVALIGGWAGKRLHLPSPALLGPVLLAATANISGFGSQPPEVAREIAFTIIGLEVGLRFTPAVLRQLGRLLPTVLTAVTVITAACGLLAWAMAATAHISLLDAYLATTPGGINAVLATASASHADITLIFAVQTLRLFLMVLVAPPLIRTFLRRNTTTTDQTGPPMPQQRAASPDASLPSPPPDRQ